MKNESLKSCGGMSGITCGACEVDWIEANKRTRKFENFKIVSMGLDFNMRERERERE